MTGEIKWKFLLKSFRVLVINIFFSPFLQLVQKMLFVMTLFVLVFVLSTTLYLCSSFSCAEVASEEAKSHHAIFTQITHCIINYNLFVNSGCETTLVQLKNTHPHLVETLWTKVFWALENVVWMALNNSIMCLSIELS